MWPEVSFAIALYLDIDHFVDSDRLSAACTSVVARYWGSHVRLDVIDGEPHWVADDEIRQHVECRDLRTLSNPVECAHAWMAEEYRSPIDTVVGELFKMTLLRVSDTRSFFYVRCHHALLDGYGAAIVLNDIAAAYTAHDDGHVAVDPDFGTHQLLLDSETAYYGSSRRELDAAYLESIFRAGNYTSQDVGQAVRVPPDHPRAIRLRAHVDGPSRKDVGAIPLIAAVSVFLAAVRGLPEARMSLPVSARTTAKLKRVAGMVSNLVPLSIPVNAVDSVAEVTMRTAAANSP